MIPLSQIRDSCNKIYIKVYGNFIQVMFITVSMGDNAALFTNSWVFIVDAHYY